MGALHKFQKGWDNMCPRQKLIDTIKPRHDENNVTLYANIFACFLSQLLILIVVTVVPYSSHG